MSSLSPLLTALIKDKSISNLGTSSIQLIATNPDRHYLIIENVSSVNIGISIQPTAAAIGTAGTVTLVPNGSIVFEANFAATNGFNVIAASGSNNPVTVWEV
jgi:hypothetical protein